VVIDENYMACEVVLNWAADHPISENARTTSGEGGAGGRSKSGIVLCFLHAATDIDPSADNDERNKSSWSNWCVTPSFKHEVSVSRPLYSLGRPQAP
jgi:hypothetical protein